MFYFIRVGYKNASFFSKKLIDIILASVKIRGGEETHYMEEVLVIRR